MTREEEIQLRKWWMDHIRELTGKLITAQARKEDTERMKAQKQLGEFNTYSDIQDAYAYGTISEAKRDRLLDLLEKKDGAPTEDKMFRLKIEFIQEDFQHQKEILARLTAEGGDGDGIQGT